MRRSNKIFSEPAAPSPQHSGILTETSPLSVSDSLLNIPIEFTVAQEGRSEEEEPAVAVPNVFFSRTRSEPIHHSAISQPNLVRGESTISATTESTASFKVSVSKMTFLRNLFHVSDNRLALKLFGSKRGIKKEEQRLMKCQHWIIHPCSKFRIYWDLFMLVVLLLNVIFLPVAISFFEEAVNPKWLIFTSFSDLVFITDVILNFWTGIVTKENVVILDRKKARKMYAKRWLILDVVSICPVDYIILIVTETLSINSLFQASRALRLLRLIKFLSLLRLFRVVRFLHYLSRWEEIFAATKSLARIVNFVMAVMLLAHWNACIQFLVPYIQGFPSDSWVSINDLQNASVATQYSWALFKAISHMLCIGFGRWPPQNTTEVWVTIISMLFGASLYAMFIGHITNLIYSVDSASRKYNEKLKQVEEYMRYRKLPSELKRRVHEYYYQRYHGQLFDEPGILHELSHAIKEEIVNFNCTELVRVVPFFASADEVFITSVITRLTFDVFLPGDYIIHCGAIGSKMYFIQHGVVDVITSDGNVATSLCDGSYFGVSFPHASWLIPLEICLLLKCRRVASVRAVTVCDLYSLTRDDFELVLEEFPNMRRIMETVADERLAMIKKTLPPEEELNTSAAPYAPTSNIAPSTSREGFTRPEDVV